MRLALFEPDIPHNTGAILRLGACFGVPVEVIEPCGFVFSDKHLKRTGMDYRDLAQLTRHNSWAAFQSVRGDLGGRLVLATTKGADSLADFRFRPDDIILLGSESAGVPDAVHACADARVRIPLAPPARSLNVGMAAAILLAEALRQTGGFPTP